MANITSREAMSLIFRPSRRKAASAFCSQCHRSLRHASSSTQPQAAPEAGVDQDLEQSTFMTSSTASSEIANAFDPVAKAKLRKQKLVPSRYQFRPPRYDRGPLHPYQSPPASDPNSREFIPGPFSSPRLESTYHSTIAPDLMTMTYIHNPPGFKPPPKAARLRAWDESSPYHQNRPLRGPRGGDVLRLLRKPITFRNIPALKKVTVHAYARDAARHGSSYIHVAGMVVQAITNVRATAHKARHTEQKWGLVKGKTTVSVTAEIEGEDMYHFLSKLVDVVLPRIKDWQGIRATTGDSSGNITFGLEPDVVGAFPEVEVNYDSYPQKMIPGCHITIHTSASTDKDARLLLTSIGIPFYGKIVD